MAITYNQVSEGFWYTPDSQKGEETPFRLKLKTIPSKELVKLQDGLLLRGLNDTISLKTGTYSVSVCKLAILDWEGVLDTDGKSIACVVSKGGMITDESLNVIPAPMFEEISNVVTTVSQDPSTLQLFKDDE